MARALLFNLLLALLALLSHPAFAVELGTTRDLAPLAQQVLALDATATDELDALTDDPVTLRALSRHLREQDAERSAALFARSLHHEEFNQYERLAGSTYAEALRAEEFGELESAAATWEAAAKIDPLTTYIVMTRFSAHPDRDALRAATRDHVKALADAARRGEPATIYTTAAGRAYPLTHMSDEDAATALRAGQSLSYVSIDTLDLTGHTFDEPVQCSRCVIGHLKGWESTFSGFSLRGFVLNDAQLGKAWQGEVNRSRSHAAARFSELLLDKVVVFGNLELDSIHVRASAGFPFLVVDGNADLRNTTFRGDLDLRFSSIGGPLILDGTELLGAAYFGHVHAGGLQLPRVTSTATTLLFNSAKFTGPVRAARCKLDHGATFEDATFADAVDLHHCRIGTRLNLSRAHFQQDARLAYVDLDDLDMLGAHTRGAFALSDSVVRGHAKFSLDGFTRRQHLDDANPLHVLYKQYQGDVDADALLTERNQYGVTHVDDLIVRFDGDVSFANTYFEKFVGFEGVTFGATQDHIATFYNTHLYGEAHFERTTFHAVADFRTISGNELSFNGAHFAAAWMLDDANVTGRLSLSDATFADAANLSFYGARLAYFGIAIDDLEDADGTRRQFYERCALDGELDLQDDRLLHARWDAAAEAPRPDADADLLARQLCLEYAIGEFVVLRDSFTKRGMTQEADWAYWNLRHHSNLQTRLYGATTAQRLTAWADWAVFEKAFGWGVRLQNLFFTSLLVILLYMALFRVLCPKVLLDWDDATVPLQELPAHALFVISLHSFLGRTRDWKSKSSNKLWKALYTTEMLIGILLITFFIGAYARIILR